MNIICENTQTGPFWPSFWNGWGHKLQIQYQPSFCVKTHYKSYNDLSARNKVTQRKRNVHRRCRQRHNIIRPQIFFCGLIKKSLKRNKTPQIFFILYEWSSFAILKLLKLAYVILIRTTDQSFLQIFTSNMVVNTCTCMQ